MLAVILAAGGGTRLKPLTAQRSKAMLPVAGRPMVERVMEGLQAAGAERLILVAGPNDAEIEPYFRSAGWRERVAIVRQPRPLGMANALLQAATLIDGDFVLSACDNLLPEAEAAALLHTWRERPGLNGLLALLRLPPEKLASSSAVALDGEWVRRIVEKPAPGQAPSDIASLPLYIFSPALLEFLPLVQPSPRGEYELQDALQRLIDGPGRVAGWLASSRRTLTRPADLLALNLHYLEQMGAAALQIGSPAPGARLHPPLLIETGVEIGPGCTLGPGVYLERGCRVEAGAELRRCVVLRGGVVGEGEKREGEVITNES